MEARGFGSDIPRTWARQSRVGTSDAALLVIAAAIAVIAIASAVWAGTFHPVWA
jgi:energy-coupling factor transport system permease protein